MSSSTNPCVEMDVDAGPVNGSSSSGGGGTLKRCSSAPMINDTNAVMATATPSTSTAREQIFNMFGAAAAQPRTRRFSASFSPVPGSPVSGLRLTPRINQLRQEDFADMSNTRELAHEREIHHAMQISQSWEDLSLMNESHHQHQHSHPGTGGDSSKSSASSSSSCSNSNSNNNNKFMGPLHVNLPPFGGGGSSGFLNNNNSCNSPSPTRLGSPLFQSPTRTPSRTTFIRRSASPVLRQSQLQCQLGVKRKLEDDHSNKSEFHIMSPAKRFHSSSSSGLLDRGGLLTTTTISATSSSSLPGSLSSSVGTPESLSSADSPSSGYSSGGGGNNNNHNNGNGNYNRSVVDNGPLPGSSGRAIMPPRQQPLLLEPMMVVSSTTTTAANKIDHDMNTEDVIEEESSN